MTHSASTCLKGPKSRARRGWKKSRRNDEIRHDLVARVRQEIADGTYDTPDKMQLALQRMLAGK